MADRITEAARSILKEAGWGWLDLRGHLHLSAPGIFVHAEIEPANTPAMDGDPFGGQSGLEVAVALLLDGGQTAGVRALAHRLGRAASTVSVVLSRFREANLVDAQNKPVPPDLFWHLASVWPSTSLYVESLPRPDDEALNRALSVGNEPGSAIGWALGDTNAAVAYGAPIGVRSDHPDDIYVPNAQVLRRASRLLGSQVV